jgi:RNA polymerase-binding transcription factor DksA
MDERDFTRARRNAEAEVDAGVMQLRRANRTPATNTECVECGEAISVLRRMASPYSKRCLACQNEAEKGGRRQ